MANSQPIEVLRQHGLSVEMLTRLRKSNFKTIEDVQSSLDKGAFQTQAFDYTKAMEGKVKAAIEKANSPAQAQVVVNIENKINNRSISKVSPHPAETKQKRTFYDFCKDHLWPISGIAATFVVFVLGLKYATAKPEQLQGTPPQPKVIRGQNPEDSAPEEKRIELPQDQLAKEAKRAYKEGGTAWLTFKTTHIGHLPDKGFHVKFKQHFPGGRKGHILVDMDGLDVWCHFAQDNGADAYVETGVDTPLWIKLGKLTEYGDNGSAMIRNCVID